MRETTTLARRSQTDERAERILADALKGRGGSLTKADAIALSGLTAAETDSALRSLMRDYKSHLAVTEEGELIYKFDPSMTRRDAPTLEERLRQVAQALWKAFMVAFKVWIAVMLVVYVAAFAAMLIALVFAQSSSDRDDDRRGSRGGGFSPWLLYWLMPDWRPAGSGYGYPSQRRLSSGTAPQKRFYNSVFDYVFGPKQAAVDPLAADREVVAFLRSARGRVTATDLVALTGWSYDRAEEEATRLLASYDGEPEVADDGSLVYSFPDLRKTAGDSVEVGQHWAYAWRQKHQVAPLTGNTSGTNTAITVMNGFNLVASLVIGPAFLLKYGLDSETARTLVTSFPLAFSGIFYAVPAGRAVRRSRAEKRVADENARAQLIGEIVSRKGASTAPAELIASLKGRATVDDAKAKKLLDKLLIDLDGDVTTDAAGAMVYRFPRLAAELEAAAAARQLAPSSERQAGQVVFASDRSLDGETSGDETPSLAPRPERGRLN